MVSLLQILGGVHAFVFRHGLVAVVVGTAVLAGCGQKGPLFLPVPPKLPAAAAPAAVPAPAAPASASR